MPELGPRKAVKLCRKNESLLTRLRIGHTPLSHMHLLKGEPPPLCEKCEDSLTVEHILLDCIAYSGVRKKYFRVDTLEKLFGVIEEYKIVLFLRNIGLYDQL